MKTKPVPGTMQHKMGAYASGVWFAVSRRKLQPTNLFTK
jgi:hypothetical protein